MIPGLLRRLAPCLCLLLVPGVAADERPDPPKLRLEAGARPVGYTAELSLVPGEDAFSGVVVIELALDRPTPLLWLNATRIQVREATLTAPDGEARPAAVVPGGDRFVGFRFDPPAPAGTARLRIAYSGEVSRKETAGLFQQEEGGDWYVFTQFQPTDARRAFPCFDEPGYKVPWRISLTVPKELLAVSNTPVVSEEPAADGRKTVRFAETRPLPSYLIALAVGPFDTVDAGRAGRRRTPLRILVPRGRGAEAAYARETTAPLLELIEEYFGQPYPYEKLDSVAIPRTAGFGAMENVGLITYNANILLAKPEDVTIGFRRSYASIGAHEIAHQWFGNLVTMAWWDDTWLNEAFATWLAAKIVDRYKPDWDMEVGRVTTRSGAMNQDSLATARRVRQPIQDENDIANAFDGITYSKGAAVLWMFETWIGEQAFRDGVRRYLTRHAWGNATATDFLSALAGDSRPELSPAFSTFLDQPGVPLISVERRCDAGSGPRLLLAQQRFLPQGSRGQAAQTWQVPVCVRYRSAGQDGRACALLTKDQGELALPASACPDWVLANDGESGYYRAHYRGDLLRNLLDDGGSRLTLSERVGILGDVAALAQTGDIEVGEVLRLVPVFAGDPNRHVVASTAGIVDRLDSHMVPPELKPHLARFVQASYGQRARDLGLLPRPGEDDDTRLLRTSVVGLAAGPGEDGALRAEAQRLARAWLDDRRAVDAEVVSLVLSVAARDGDRALFDRLRTEAKRSEDRRERMRMLGALGSFRNLELFRAALGLILGDEFHPMESLGILFDGLNDSPRRELVFDFVKENFDAIAARVPREYASALVFVTTAFCNPKDRADAEAFFKTRADSLLGGPRRLAQALEVVDLCIARKAAQQAGVAEFLRRY